MEYNATQTLAEILCCQCGVPTERNTSNMCIACIKMQVDITEDIQKQAYLQFCKGCERYLQPPSYWVACILESRELLAVCLKRLKGLSKVHLVDAGFVWTEPHSKRLKVKLTIQKEVLASTILEQTFVVDFTIQGQMCDDCHRREAQDFWKAVVQIRQKVSHKKTFFYLEQVIMKQNIHANCLNVKRVHEGLDFYFANKHDGKKMVDFLSSVVPCRYKTSERLISHDIQNNLFNEKKTFSVELAPICKDDIVCLPPKVARSLSNMGQIAICIKISNCMQFLDPNTGQVGELSPTAYWRTPFTAFASRKQLSQFTAIEVDTDDGASRQPSTTTSPRYCLADVYVMRDSDMGTGSDTQFHCRSHLGHVLNPGDTVLGFDFTTANCNDEHLERMKEDRIPEIVLLKKSYGDKKKRSAARQWKLKSIAKEEETNEQTDSNEFDEFLEDLEEDAELRQNINIYRDRMKMVKGAAESDLPLIALEEMLDDLAIEDQPMKSVSDDED